MTGIVDGTPPPSPCSLLFLLTPPNHPPCPTPSHFWGSWKTLPSMLQSAVGEETAGAAPLEERSAWLHTSHVITSSADFDSLWCVCLCGEGRAGVEGRGEPGWGGDEPSNPGNTVGCGVVLMTAFLCFLFQFQHANFFLISRSSMRTLTFRPERAPTVWLSSR